MKNRFFAGHPARGLPLTTIAAALLVLAGLLPLILFTTPAQAAPPAQTPDKKPSVVGGQSLWSENCLPCHGPTGRGDGPTAQSIPDPLPNFADPANARQYVPIENFDVIKNGRMEAMMPPWSNQFNDSQIWDAVAQVWRLGTSPQAIATGRQVYQQQCAACHGDDGSGNGPEAGTDINNFTDLAVMVQSSQTSLFEAYQASDQHADLTGLSEAEVWQSLDYIRTFSFEMPARNGTLAGQVLNAATGSPVGNVPVTLHAFQNNARLESFTAQADENGNYTFENLLTEHTVIYVVEGQYENVEYVSREPGMFMPDSNETALNLEVYDTTTSPDAISITQLHYLVSFGPGVANILQIYIVGNDSNQTYIGEDGQTFTFELPPEAFEVNFQNDPTGQRFIRNDERYIDTEPVMPGEEGLTIAAVYNLPYSGDSLDIALPLPMDTADVNVLLTNQGVTLTSNQVDFVEDREFQGNQFAVFNGADIAAGQTLALNITGLDDVEFEPAANVMGSNTSDSTTWFNQEWAMWTVMGLGLLVVVVVGVGYPLARPRLTHLANQSEEDVETHRQRLLLTLARLDEAYNNGELDEDVYHNARAKYKAELADLLEMG